MPDRCHEPDEPADRRRRDRGPEIFYAGPMLEASPLTGGDERGPAGIHGGGRYAPGGRQRVADLARQGASMVKTFNKFDRDVYRHLVEAAAKCSLKVVHDPGEPLFNAIPIDVAIDLGVTSIEHAKAPWPVVLTDDLRREHDSLLVSGDMQARMAFMARVADIDTASVSVERLHRLGEKMIERGAYLCPTLEALMLVEDVAFEQVREQLGVDEMPEMVKDIIRQQIRAMEAVSRLSSASSGPGRQDAGGPGRLRARDTFGEM